MTVPNRWRKSTRSANTGNCVEIHGDLDAVRDSKNSAGPTLRLPIADLVSAIRDGKLISH